VLSLGGDDSIDLEPMLLWVIGHRQDPRPALVAAWHGYNFIGMSSLTAAGSFGRIGAMEECKTRKVFDALVQRRLRQSRVVVDEIDKWVATINTIRSQPLHAARARHPRASSSTSSPRSQSMRPTWCDCHATTPGDSRADPESQKTCIRSTPPTRTARAASPVHLPRVARRTQLGRLFPAQLDADASSAWRNSSRAENAARHLLAVSGNAKLAGRHEVLADDVTDERIARKRASDSGRALLLAVGSPGVGVVGAGAGPARRPPCDRSGPQIGWPISTSVREKAGSAPKRFAKLLFDSASR